MHWRRALFVLGAIQHRGDTAHATYHSILAASSMRAHAPAHACTRLHGLAGLRLSKTIALPGGGQHFFFELPHYEGGAPSSLAFFWFEDAMPPQPGVSAPDLKQMIKAGRHPSAIGYRSSMDGSRNVYPKGSLNTATVVQFDESRRVQRGRGEDLRVPPHH